MDKLHSAAVTILTLSLALKGVAAQYGPAANEITSLPGFSGPLPSKQYGGYLNVPNSEKKLFYILVISENDPANDPLVLWINGGPGCSSLGGGYIEEHGPFVYTPSALNGTNGLLYDSVALEENPYSWSKVANMLYIDSPAGTGMSYSTNPADYVTDDFEATMDLYEALLTFFEQYTYFANSTFYITGESYAGVYVPLTASLILGGLADGREPNINLVGYAIGNPSTDPSINYNQDGLYQGFHLISQELGAELSASNCPETLANFNESAMNGANYDYDANVCTSMQDMVGNLTSAVFNYDINKDCFYGQQTFNQFYFNQTKDRLLQEGIDWQDNLSEYQPMDDYCDYDDRVAHFLLNDQSVRDAIHAAPFANSTQTLLGFFEMCTSRINYTQLVETTIPYHMDNIAAGLEVLVYSGDHDTVVPTDGTEKWTSDVGQQLGLLQPWSPWWIQQPDAFGYQIGGYLTQYNGLSFITIRSAGHQVPTTKPYEALTFFSAWIQGALNETTVKPDNLVLTQLFPPATPVASYR